MKGLSKTLIALFIGLLIFGNTNINAQTNIQSLIRGKGWQVQNPPNPNLSMIFLFYSDKNVVKILAMNFLTGEKGELEFSCSYKGNQITLQTDEGEEIFRVYKINENSITLVQGEEKTICALVGSSEDKFAINYMNSRNNGYNYSIPQYNQPTNNSSQTCVSCYGDGRCHVCGGSGVYSRYGQSHTCTACYGTGKCSICGGKGRY